MITIDKVAEPPPALASTTSVPASWMRFVSAAVAAVSKETDGVACMQVKASMSIKLVVPGTSCKIKLDLRHILVHCV